MTKIGSAYAQGLYTLAKEEGLTQLLLQQLDVLHGVLGDEPAFLRLLSSPNLSKQERLHILDDSFRDKVHPYVLNFLKLMTEKGNIRHFPYCCTAFRQQYNEEHGILPVQAVSAVPLTDSQLKRLTEKLCIITGKTVELTNRVAPECLGGVRLDYDGKRLDGTVKNRLETVAALLKNTVI